jgi:exopolysaccharide biosynthesis polyprenyl glycosylphosphotransferase
MPIGFVGPEGSTEARPVASLGGLRGAILERGADCVFVASTEVRADDVATAATAARRTGVDLWISANLPQILATRLSVQPIGKAMAVSVSPVTLTGTQALTKRAFDLVVGTIALVALSPVILVAAIAVATGSRGPVLYRQTRLGHRGRPFTMLKLRTMVRDADARLPEVAERNEAADPLFKIARDPRITRVGRVLRRFSIDELPQLLHVLRGTMSLVGPRPPLPREAERYEERHFDRLEVRPGITGLWQVSGRSDLSFEDYVRLDVFYIENWSVAYDLFILLKTVQAVLLGRGSY